MVVKYKVFMNAVINCPVCVKYFDDFNRSVPSHVKPTECILLNYSCTMGLNTFDRLAQSFCTKSIY